MTIHASPAEETPHSVTAEVLAALLSYDPQTGVLVWKPRDQIWFNPSERWTLDQSARRWNTRYAGTVALNSPNGKGHLYGFVFGRPFAAHRAAWAVHTGALPVGVIDHINGDGFDNRIKNLRDVTVSINNRNRRMSPTKPAVFCGVRRRGNGWEARASLNKKSIRIGSYASLEEAIWAREAFNRENGFGPNHGA